MSPELLLDLLLQPDQQDYQSHEDMAPVEGDSMLHTADVIRISPVDIMVLLPGLTFLDLRIIIYITPN